MDGIEKQLHKSLLVTALLGSIAIAITYYFTLNKYAPLNEPEWTLLVLGITIVAFVYMETISSIMGR